MTDGAGNKPGKKSNWLGQIDHKGASKWDWERIQGREVYVAQGQGNVGQMKQVG